MINITIKIIIYYDLFFKPEGPTIQDQMIASCTRNWAENDL